MPAIRRIRPAKPGLTSSRRQPKAHRLHALTDQGPPCVLRPSDFGAQGRDPGWGALAEGFMVANSSQLSALALEPVLGADKEGVRLSIRPGGVVGAVPLRAADSRKVTSGIVVRPRFGWNGIGGLLSHIGWSAIPKILDLPLVPGSAREIPPWVLAGPALKRFAALLQCLRNGFRLVEDVPTYPRGQVMWQRYATIHVARGAFHRLPCRYPELGPDLILRSYLRWGIQSVQRGLTPHAATDPVAEALWGQAQTLLAHLQDIPARRPDHRALDRFRRGTELPSGTLSSGLEALGWITDERGLAGRSQSDGLAWALPMHDLFERWVEHLVRTWARGIGGEVRTGREHQTTVSIRWQRAGRGSLTSLVPDVLVRHRDQVVVFDAKYKDHLQELDETQWTRLTDDTRAQHRHDVHQVIAYAGLFEASRVTAVLVYPLRPETWDRLRRAQRTIVRADLIAGPREVGLALVGVPMQGDHAVQDAILNSTFDQLWMP